MKLFGPLYDFVLSWSRHRHAPRYLAGMSFAESSFFPIPPDVMLMPMSLARPEKAIYFAWLTTLFSVLGGLLGYLIGMWLLDWFWPVIERVGYAAYYDIIVELFAEYGIWIIVVAGFSPLPYKMFTITAGATSMALLPFVIASIIGRGARFFLVASLMKWGGAKMEPYIRKWVEWLGWAFVLVVFGFIGYKLL
ncbi:YqaA family protein [Thiomicrospira cyclica]|uniref:SNARE associated Golgi protein-like protein n=1 Tax=Thiomicrospira cyclica (strain DSM 14477 / JCM 11371 / ALM1) TaxID=717773 RepID=F6DCA2_THICA|nr:VTT domain-containing protein [Thiomicrospira cyclica]AEG31488.1 SNARE associated Golgi protein-like protein [Thiomicrospira cyclica ALM1]